MTGQQAESPTTHVRWAGRTAVLDVRGEVSKANRDVLKRALRDLLDRQPERILLNLTEARSFDDALLTAAVETHALGRKLGVTVALCGANEPLRGFIRASRMDQVMSVSDAEQDALSAGGEGL